MKTKTRIAASFIGVLLLSPVDQLLAATVGYDAEYNSHFTDNALEAQDGEVKQKGLSNNYRLGFFGNTTGARAKTDFQANIEFVDYRDDSSEDQALTSFLGSSEIAVTSRTVTWLVADALGYYDTDPSLKFNSRSSDRVNYFATGPKLQYQVGPGVNVGSKFIYTNFNRTGREEDYNKLDWDVSWIQSLNARDNWGLGLDHILMLYPDEADKGDYITTDLAVSFDRKTPSNLYAISLGGTYLQTESDGTDVFVSFDASWDHSFTRRMGFVLDAGYNLTDASVLKDNQLSETGEIENNTESGLFYEKQVGAGFRYQGVASEFGINVSARALEYVQGPVQTPFVSNDHNTYSASTSYRKFIGRSWDVDFGLGVDQKSYAQGGFQDRLYTASLSSHYVVTRSIDLTLAVEHLKGEDNIPSASGDTASHMYDENTVSIGILWDPYKSRRSSQSASEFNLSIIK